MVKGQLVIQPAEAEVIRRIFREYANGISPQKIAASLNSEGVPAPRARAGSGHWKQNTINGNRDRGTGILNNDLYIGQRVWNRRPGNASRGFARKMNGCATRRLSCGLSTPLSGPR
ncbi:recombinase family protein [uncultured Paracoccus sp.]|uniref:recombinase family protein n=1 Tax=uncultured Paracoccus sp. TaxID=189685 RepID=UPI00345A1971